MVNCAYDVLSYGVVLWWYWWLAAVLSWLSFAEQSAACCRTVRYQTVMLKTKERLAQCSNSWQPLQPVLL